MFNTIGFIGTGTMGSAVARAVVKGAPGASILLSNRTPAKAEALAKGLGVQASDNETVARTCPERPLRAGLHGRRSGRPAHPGYGRG